METNPDLKNSGIKRCLFCFPICAVVLLMCASGCQDRPSADNRGNTPEDVAHDFLKAVQSEEYEKAASLWTAEALASIERSPYYNSFTNFCELFAPYDRFEVSTRKGKSVYYHVVVECFAEGRPKEEKLLTCRMSSGQWRLHR